MEPYTCFYFYKQPSCSGSNVKNGLNVKKLAKQRSLLKTLMQRNLVGLWTKNFTFLILSSLKLNFSTTVSVQLNCVQQYLGQILVTIKKLLILHIVVFMTGLSKWARTPLVALQSRPPPKTFYFKAQKFPI